MGSLNAASGVGREGALFLNAAGGVASNSGEPNAIMKTKLLFLLIAVLSLGSLSSCYYDGYGYGYNSYRPWYYGGGYGIYNNYYGRPGYAYGGYRGPLYSHAHPGFGGFHGGGISGHYGSFGGHMGGFHGGGFGGHHH